jgi:hypothetical protein
MARYVSLNMRTAINAEQTDSFPIVLVRFTGPDLEEPVLLSTDPTVRLSDDPLKYGTRSNGDIYQFVLMGVLLPDDKEASPPAAQIILDNVADDMVAQVRAAGLNIAVEFLLVWSNALDVVEQRFENFRLVGADYNVSTITLKVSQQPILDEPFPSQRMTPSRFPGLFP